MERQYPPEFKRPPDDDENWIEQYAPEDEAENAYFHGRTPEPRTPRPGTAGRPHKKHRWPWVLAALIIIAAAGWLAFGNRKASAPAPKPAVKQSTQATQTAAPTKHYDSANFNLGVDYPQDWKVADTGEKLTITSPAEQLKTSNGKTVSVHVIVMVRPQQTSLPEFAKGPAAAVWDSTKLTYKNPTQNQRAQTYLSSLSYAGSPASSFDAYYLTGDNGYQAGQVVPMSDIVQTDPLVNVYFAQCKTDDCSDTPTPVSLQASAWQQNSLASKLIQQILASMSFN